MVHAAPCFNIVAASQRKLLAREHSVHDYSCMAPSPVGRNGP